MTTNPQHSPDWLTLDVAAEIERTTKTIREQVRSLLRKKGAVVAVSGGVDSSVCLALCVKALGKENVLALSLPERDSSSETITLGHRISAKFGVQFIVDDITPALIGSGCYAQQLDAIRHIVPEFNEQWKHKITLPSILEAERLNISYLTVQSPDGELQSIRMPYDVYLQLVAATNSKQRTRKMIEYSFADRYHFAVCGTPNRLEYDQGFFVKQGDGAADFKPIAHLYKSQVYQLAEALDIPEEIRTRVPTTDTYSLPQTQEEFYFSVPYRTMDICLYGLNHEIPPETAAEAAGLTPEQIRRIYEDIRKKRRATQALHLPPLLIEDVPEISGPVQDVVRQSKRSS